MCKILSGVVRVSVAVLFMFVFAMDVQAECGCGDDVPCEGSCLLGACTRCGYIKEDGPCGALSGNAIRSCESGTHCSSPLGSGTCVAKSGSNQYCLKDSHCKSGLVCEISQARCRHDPPEAGEACSNIWAQCKSGEGLYCGSPPDDPLDSRTRCLSAGKEGDQCGGLIFPPCNEDAGLFCASIFEPEGGLTCKRKRSVGEACWDSSGCRDGLRCDLCVLEGCDEGQACFPVDKHDIWPPEVCMGLHSPAIHKSVIDDELTATFGAGSSVTIFVATASDEIGNAYGSDGRYGCYLTTCLGFEPGLGIADFASFGQYWEFGSVAGVSEVVNLSIGAASGILGGSVGFGIIRNLDSEVIGISESMTLGVGLSPPLSGSLVQCHTTLDVVAALEDLDDPSSLVVVENTPPVAVCADGLSVCVGAHCEAPVDIDGGSYDPDGESLVLSQLPAGPFTPGTHRIDLEVTDPDGESDSCFDYVDVEDCTAPRVTCPQPVETECTSPLGAQVSYVASAQDNCSGPVTADCEPDSGSWFALGENALGCSASDDAGNLGLCQSSVTVVDTTPPDVYCNSPGRVIARDFPLTIEASAGDICDDALALPTVRNARCVKQKGNGREVDVTAGCGLAIEDNRLSIHNGTGVGTTIRWEIEASDASGNSASTECTVEIVHPVGKS